MVLNSFGTCQHTCATPGQGKAKRTGYDITAYVRDISSRGVQKCDADTLTRHTETMRGVVVDRDDEPALTPNLASAIQTDRVLAGSIQGTGDRSLCIPAQERRKRQRG